MSAQSLIVYGADESAAMLQARAAEVADRWPDGAVPPSVEIRPLEALATNEADVPNAGVVLLDAGETNGRGMLKLLDRLRELGASGVVLAAPEHADVAASSNGLIVRARTIDDTTLAQVLHAVFTCDQTASELRRELRIAQKTSGGVREEMSRISQELSLASKIQQELIPKQLPRIEGVDFGVLYRPAGYVSGDIYNIAQLDERRTAFFIADAVGHGVPAALLTMIISRSLPMRGGTTERKFITPTEALGTLNTELCDVSDGTPRFATAVYGIVDRVSGLVRIANAGHPQPMRITAHRVAKVEAGGPLLGVFHEAEFEEEVFTLEPGETLLLYSDGFETAFPDADAMLRGGGGPSPSTRYIDQLLSIGRRKKTAGESVGEALRLLEGRLDSACGSLHQLDDVTALALERTAA